MSLQRKSEKTRERLLRAGGEVFGAKGFRGATIAEICEKAGANIASVNYHFRDKENLYVEAWRDSFRRNMPFEPDPELPAVERLMARVKAMLEQTRRKDVSHFAIFMKERANPTGLLNKSAKEMFATMREHMASIVREIIPAKSPQKTVDLCVMSIMGQCLHFTHRAMMQRQMGKQAKTTAAEIRRTADHIVRFSLAGMECYGKEEK